jgi:hypothetical protein
MTEAKTTTIAPCRLCGKPPGTIVGPPAMARCITEGCEARNTRAFLISDWNEDNTAKAPQHPDLVKEIEYWLRVIGDRQGADRRFSDTARDMIAAMTASAEPVAQDRTIVEIDLSQPAHGGWLDAMARVYLVGRGYDSNKIDDLWKDHAPEWAVAMTVAKVYMPPISIPPSDAARERCSDCPPIGYPTDKTRCCACDRRKEVADAVSAGYRRAIEDLGQEGDYQNKDWSEPYQFLKGKAAALSAAPVSAARGIDIRLEQGNAGLWYVTSVAIPGLLVTGATHQEAIAGIGQALLEIQDARAALDRNERAPEPDPPTKVTAVAARSLADRVSQLDLKALMRAGTIDSARACLRRALKRAMGDEP